MVPEKDMASIVLTPELARMEIGCRVAVRWPNDGRYYEGTVCRERNTKTPFCVAYDSGEYEWIDFHRRKFRLLESGDEPNSESSAGKHRQSIAIFIWKQVCYWNQSGKGKQSRATLCPV